jgi:hypothetical protein
LTTKVEATDGSGGGLVDLASGVRGLERPVIRVAPELRRLEEMRLRFVSAVVPDRGSTSTLYSLPRIGKGNGACAPGGDRSMKQLAKLTVYI